MSTTKDKMKVAVGVTTLALVVTVVLAVIFMPAISENPLVAHIIGIVEGAFLTMLNFYWGTSKSSEDKTKIITRKNDEGVG